METTECLAPEALYDFVSGRLAASRVAAVELHLDACEACRHVVSEVALAFSLTAGDVLPAVSVATIDSEPGSTVVSQPIAAGTEIGRFRVLERLGEGGMGVVYVAFDAELDRKVAIKLLHPRDDGELARQRERLRREARTMAKLSHPNAVTVHEVGTFGARLFIAMELVDGVTLSAWIRSRTPGLREIIGLFAQAGAGLAAAHAAGIVHRDFKPDNVLVGSDGRVRITDFGLSRAAEVGVIDAPLVVGTDLARAITQDATERGALVGTPAYMAPEQFRGQPADARSDQFAFAVALWEAVFGQRPFAGRTLAELADNVCEGRLVHVRRAKRVPRWLRAMLVRALATRPEDRHPSMDTVLAELRRDRGRRLAWAVGAVVASGIAGGMGLAALADRSALAAVPPVVQTPVPAVAVDDAAQRCAGGDERVKTVWNEERRQAITTAFAATGASFAESASDRVDERVSEWVEDWAEEYRKTCEATAVRHEQSEALMDRKLACLEQQIDRLDESLRLLGTPDVAMVTRADAALGDLPMPQFCTDPELLDAEVKLPADDEYRERVVAFNDRMSEVAAKVSTEDPAVGVAAARELVAEAEALAWPTTLAYARLQLGLAQVKADDYAGAEKTLVSAIASARGCGYDEIAMWGSVELVHVVGLRLGRLEDARSLLVAAEGEVARRNDRLAEATLAAYAGSLAFDEGDYESSRKHHTRSMTAYTELYGPRDTNVAEAQRNRGVAALRIGDVEAGLADLRAAAAIYEGISGRDHPSTLDARSGIGEALVDAGRPAEALVEFEAVLEAREAATPRDELGIAHSHTQIGSLLDEQGRKSEAIAHERKSLKIRERVLGPDHLLVARSLANLALSLGEGTEAVGMLQRAIVIQTAVKGTEHEDTARMHDMLGNVLADSEPARALVEYRRALEIMERVRGPSHLQAGLIHNNLARALSLLEDEKGALEHHRRAAQIVEAALGPDDVHTATALAGLAGSLLLTGELEEARDTFERVLAMREKLLGPDHPATVTTRDGLEKLRAHMASR